MPTERENAITFRGNPTTLIGPEIKVGQKAPDFTGVGQGIAPTGLNDFQDKVKVLLTDKENTVQYAEYVPEVAQEPNYEAAQAAIEKLSKK